MTSAEFEVFLSGAMWVCAVMAIVVALRAKARGPSAYVMSVAFLAVGGVLYLVKTQASQGWIIAGAVVVAVLLVVDFALRARDHVEKGNGP
jgi:hypothetical protein